MDFAFLDVGIGVALLFLFVSLICTAATAIMELARDASLAVNVTQKSILSWGDPWAEDIAARKAERETWFDGTMDRVSGWYKRRTQIFLFFIGLGAAIVLNIDTIAVVKALSTSPALRDAAVAQAGQILAAADQA